jgi:GTP-binding protein Era
MKSGFVSIVGRPNVGKSTLMNRLIGEKIAITSDKPQTTRSRIRTVYTDKERGQIVFSDTPGYIKKTGSKLNDFMMDEVRLSVDDSDLVCYLIEPSEFIGEGDQAIIEKLKKTDTPVILIINKIDEKKDKAELLPVISKYKDELSFAAIVPISARTGNGVDDLLDEIFKNLPEGPMYYPEDELTDQPTRVICAEIIREKALRLLSQEVPHGIAVVVESFKQRKNQELVDIEATIYTEKDSHKGIIIGKGGSMLKKIGTASRIDIEKFLQERVNLKLWVKVKKDWRDSKEMLRNFGYEEKKEES